MERPMVDRHFTGAYDGHNARPTETLEMPKAQRPPPLACRWVALLAMATFISAIALAAGPPAAIEGPWLTQDGGGVIDIEPCGALYCGRIVGMAVASSSGPLPKDVNGNSRCGLEIIRSVGETGPAEWTGKITNPEDGQTYSTRLTVDDRGRLRLRGYVLVPLLGQTQIWTRYGGGVTAGCRMVPADRPKPLSERLEKAPVA
jgi:uncharacterized protein (DUF2147 family)